MITYSSRHYLYELAPLALRGEMTDRVAIIKRMTSDLNGTDWTADTVISENYFTLLGWTKAQVQACGPQAIERSRAASLGVK